MALYDKRLKIFIYICLAFLFIIFLRLGRIQLYPSSAWKSQVEKLRGNPQKQLPTLRGRILDRNSNVLAVDEARFAICMNYKSTRLLDEQFWKSKVLLKLKNNPENQSEEQIRAELQDEYAGQVKELQQTIKKVAAFQSLSPAAVEQYIQEEINKPIWQLITYFAWKWNFPDQPFEQAEPDANERLLLAAKVKIAEMYQDRVVVELQDSSDAIGAQLEFVDSNCVKIISKARRYYPYADGASHIIGWVKPWQRQDQELFNEDELLSYLHGELSGFYGIEYVCEPVLRGRRGKLLYNLDKEIISRTDTLFGKDVHLTIDIKLQQRITTLLTDPDYNLQFYNKPMAVAVIDIASSEILATVSLPQFDLNTARQNYGKLLKDPDNPLINRAINKNYAPGSTIKPLILIAGMQERKVTSGEIIDCMSYKPEKPPRCWREKEYGAGHSDQWTGLGGNCARNALKGSCNVYFSRLAERIRPKSLQRWLYKFGWGYKILQSPYNSDEMRNFRQSAGIISSGIRSASTSDLEKMPPIEPKERRNFGIGQGNIRATPLQVANAMATIARNGIYKTPKLLRPDSNDVDTGQTLGIDSETLRVVADGMHAVVNESDGTAYDRAFAESDFASMGVTVYGKTGSTEQPSNAWFAGFAEDSDQRAIAVAVVVEGGEHGSSHAAPLGRDIISICIEEGYIGNR